MYNAEGSFARKQLEKHGWTEGCGLGTNQQGISRAIKVKIKKDNTGVGHDPGKEFTDHWWNHLYNKAASRLIVEENEDGVVLKKKEVTSKERTETAKKTLYSNFIKSSTLTNGTETKVEKEGGNSEDETHQAVSTLLLPDDELLRICGGRTGHKGARHGLKLTGKLARLEEQERLLMERKSNPSTPAPSLTTPPPQNGRTEDSPPSCVPDDLSGSKRKKKCKKRRRDERENEDGEIEESVALCDNDKVRMSPESEDSLSASEKKKKKKKRRKKERVESEDEERERRRKEGEEERNDEESLEKERKKERAEHEEMKRERKKRKKEDRTATECEENGKEEKKRKKKESVENEREKERGKRKKERKDREKPENETENKDRKKAFTTENDVHTVTTETGRSHQDTEEDTAKVKKRQKKSKTRSSDETGDICSNSQTEAKHEEACEHTSTIAPTSSDLHDSEEEEEERKEKRKKSKKKKKSKSDVC